MARPGEWKRPGTDRSSPGPLGAVYALATAVGAFLDRGTERARDLGRRGPAAATLVGAGVLLLLFPHHLPDAHPLPGEGGAQERLERQPGPPIESSGPDKPHVVLVVSDHHRSTAWGGGGNPDVHTPHMDALARGGAVFRNGVSSSPLCVPARHALLTGHLARDARLLDNQPLPEVSSGLPGLAESFRAAGYGTAFIGKLHLDTEFPAPPVRRLGFETWIEAADYDRPFATRYFAPHTRDHVEGGPEVLPYAPGEYAPAGQLRHLLEYVEDRLLDDPERPLFTVLAWSPPHPTLKESGGHHYGDAPPEWHRFYADRALTTRPNVPVEVTEKLLPHLRGYYAHISAIDEQLGRLAEGLRRLGIARRTIVVYTSDHGDLLGSHGLLEKRLPYLESLLVPLIWSWPGRIPAGTEHHTAMSTLDIGPTLLGLAGVEPPSDLEGADLSGLLLGSEVEAPSSAFITCRLRSRDGGATWRGVHSSGYTYAVPEPGIEPPPGFPMLFDNESDPYQLNNLYGDPVHSDLQAELERESIARQLALGLRPYETH